MNPNDPRKPSSERPQEMPRPYPRHIDGFAPRTPQRIPPRPQVVPERQPPLVASPVAPQLVPTKQPTQPAHLLPQSQPQSPHPAEHMLPAPHEPLLSDGISHTSLEKASTKKKWSVKKKLLAAVTVLIVIGIAIAITGYALYAAQLQPASSDKNKHVRLTIAPGSSPYQIGEKLKSEGVIQSALTFNIYTYVSHTRDQLKAGSYNLQPSEALPEIVRHIVAGKQDEFSMTFLPGDTLENHRKRLIEAGYGSQEVDEALAASYSNEILRSKPASADLEGYIYGQTYNFDPSASAKDIIKRTFDEFEKQAVAKKLAEGFKQQGLTFYEGITLASIIQREVSNPADEKQVAQVFYSRLKNGMTLGSDVTYQYAAKKLSVTPDPSLDSPYNTRKYTGLPPGPIASPGISALEAAAYPAAGNYLYFLSGDDDKTYFATTNQEHERNVAAHCQNKCRIN